MIRMTSAMIAIGMVGTSAVAQQTTAPAAAQEAPLVIAPSETNNRLVLPANTEVMLSLNDELSSKANRQGDTFSLSVVHNVMAGNHVVIPQGSRAVGEVTWLTGKGAFGKSGKMNIQMRYIEVGGRRVPIEASFRQEGEGNTAATVGTVIVAGVFGGFVTGKTAIIPRGRELAAHTKNDLSVEIAAPFPAPQLTPASPSADMPKTTAAQPIKPTGSETSFASNLDR